MTGESSPAGAGLGQDKRGLARRSAFNFVGLGVSSATQFVLVLVLAHFLAPRQAGIFFEGFAAVKLLVVGATLGLDVTAVRYVALHRAVNDPERVRGAIRYAVRIAVGTSIVVAAATALAAGPASGWFGAPGLAPVLRIFAAGVPFAVAEAVLIGATRGTGRMHGYVLVDQILDGTLRVSLVAVAVLLGAGAAGAALASTATSVVTCLAAGWVARDYYRGRGELTREARRGLLRFSMFQWGTVLAGTGTLWADTLLLGIWRPPSQVAAYSLATRTVLLGLVFVLPISIAFQPMIGRLHTLGEIRALQTMYGYATRLASLLGGPPLILVAVLATPILTELYSSRYIVAATPLAILAVAQVANAVTGPCGYIVTMIGRTDLTFKINLSVVVVNIGLNVILIPAYGMTGAGVAWGCAVVLSNALRLHQVRRCLHVHPFDRATAGVATVLIAFTVVVAAAARVLEHDSNLFQVVAVSAAGLLTLLIGLALVPSTRLGLASSARGLTAMLPTAHGRRG